MDESSLSSPMAKVVFIGLEADDRVNHTVGRSALTGSPDPIAKA